MGLGKRFRRCYFRAITGFLLALMIFEGSHALWPALIPSPTIPTTVEAATGTIDPDGNGTVVGARTTCTPTTTNNFDCVNDAVRNPTAPSTAGDYVQLNRTQADNYTMGTLTNVSSVSSITVHIYHMEGNVGHQFDVRLFDAAETTQYGTTQNVTIRTAAQWDTVTFSGLTMTQAQLDGLRIRTTCNRPGTGNFWCRDYEMYAVVTYTENINITVAGNGTQQNIDAGTTNQHVGGSFAIQGTNGSRSVTGLTINENGTVDGSANLKNIKLYYDFDTSNPYNCVSESFSIGVDTLFAAADADGFSGANGSSAFTNAGVPISPTQTMCVYVILDVQSGAGSGQTIEVEITAPQTDVVASGAPVITPATAVAISGATTIQKTVRTLEHYHWRNDNGTEAGATSATGGTENTVYSSMPKSVTKRLRLSVNNAGNKTSAATQYRLEYGTKVTTCAAIASWTDVGGAGGDFDMSNSANLTDGNDTTDVSVATGGVSNPNTTFLTPNAGVKDTSSQTGNITLTSTQYVELEYAIIAASGIADGTSYCFRVTSSGTALEAYTRYAEAAVSADILVSASGSVTSPITVPQTDQYAGGKFVLDEQLGNTQTITSIKVRAGGTVNAQTKITNVRLRYDLDTSAPYDCVSETHAGTEPLYDPVARSFNGSNEATFTGSQSVGATQTLCAYVIYSASSTISNNETLALSINNPSTDVVAGSISIGPSTAVSLGTITFNAPFIKQNAYHWRNDDGNESGATSATGGTENTALTNTIKGTNYRLRFGVANTGGASSPSNSYRLEWAQKVSTCSAASGWARIDTAADAWQIAPSGNITDGGNTTNIGASSGGVSNGATTFLAANGGVKDTSDQTAAVVLPGDNYLELEYSISPTTNAVQSATYCFRVTKSGTTLDQYDNYAEATIKLDTDFKVQRGVTTLTGDTASITAGTDYVAPASATSAFIRITNTQLSGAGPNTGAGNSNASDVTVYITNPTNIMSGITFQRGTGAAGNTRVSWEIVEYKGSAGGENEMIVRDQGNLTYGGATTAVTSGAVSGIATDADVAVFVTAQFNPDTGRNNYHLGLSTAAWNAAGDTTTMTRSTSGNAAIVSYAVVEFTGTNWKVQRSEHTYAAVGATETESITAVNSLSRAFLHVQKRTAQTNHADIGHEVWLSGIGQISYALDGAATTAANHTSVAWVLENTQTTGLKMDVTRSNATLATSGTSPQTNNISIGKTLSDITVASIFTNNRSDTNTRTWPEPYVGARIISTTQYELWRSDAAANVAYRTEVIEWPTAARKLTQNYFRLYVDNNALKPTDPWPVGGTNLGENSEMTANDVPTALSDNVRIRMSLAVSAAAMPATLDAFKLQYAKRVTTCSAIGTWYPLGDVGSTTALWRGVNNTPADGTALSGDPPTGGDLLLSVSDRAGTYEEQNDSALNPFLVYPGEDIEYDWLLEHNGAADKSSYCFRMAEADGSNLFAYSNYPVIRTVGYEPLVTDWRWYDDETNATPSSPRGGENVSASNMQFENAFKLRLVLRESSGAQGNNVKFALQYSQYADFSQGTATVTASTTCTNASLWCYHNGAGTDNSVINSKVIASADACSGGVGTGCGTHNEGISVMNATYDQPAFADAEYEFTIKHAGARSNRVYYFRLYNITYNEVVGVAATYSNPSLVTEGATLTFGVAGLASSVSTAGIVTDVTTSATDIPFGTLPFNTDYEAAQRMTVTTNATQGYQVLKFATDQMRNGFGDAVPAVTGTNATPSGWSTGCVTLTTGCFGYHTTDATLQSGSSRFAATDSYAALETTPREIMFSSIPITGDIQDLVYKVKVGNNQPVGDYTTTITYIAVPVH